MTKEHLHNFLFLKFMLNKELDELLISVTLRFLALSMIAIFIPIYLLHELHFSLQQVIYFFIVLSIFFSLFSIVGAKIASKIGFKHAILLSVPFQIAFFWLLYNLSNNSSLYLLSAAIEGMGIGIYWISHHTNFAKYSVKKKRGEELGILNLVATIAAIIGPLIGGIILKYFGFFTLFSIVSIILVLSTVPLFFSKEFHEKSSFSLKYIFKKEHFKDAAAYTARGAELIAASVVWPIFIFSILKGYFSLGLVVTITGLFTSLLSVYIGKLSDKIGKRKFIRLGTLLDSSTWLIRGFSATVFQVYLINIATGLTSIFFLPFDALTYSKANRGKRVEYLVFREIFLGLGRVVILLVFLLTSSYFATFVVTGLAEFLFLLF